MSRAPLRSDIQPVILGGDLSAYPMGREFYEAYGLTSICVAPKPIAAIKHSRFFCHYYVEQIHQENVRDALLDLAHEYRDKKLVVLGNWDAAVEMLEQLAPGLPANVICPIPPHEPCKLVSDKLTFAELCARHDLVTPRTEVVRLAGTEPIPPTAVPFPLVAKPSVSSEYSHLHVRGFQKVYFMQEQAQLDLLWHDLREVGFASEFLVQELISGDDTYMDSITMYVNRNGVATLQSSAQVLLEDHTPSLFGNPVAMITRPMPELWEHVAAMLKEIGWHGFANIDLKRNPTTGTPVFMDFNPRVGANSYYSAAAGANPMRILVEDYIDGICDTHCISDSILYTRVPVRLTRRYVRDSQLLAEYDALVRAGKVYNPLCCPEDTVLSRMYGTAMTENFVKKFKQYYSEPTDTSF